MGNKKTRTPQEKKKLSYEKDRRNNYGENKKSSYKAIKMRKRRQNRNFRHNGKNAIKGALITTVSDIDLNLIKKLGDGTIKIKKWKKVPDISLGEYIKIQKEKGKKRENRKVNKKRKQ